ncbi:MAG: sulfurtransferase-like selenium metabolism protein YedF [Clostridia bacterium]|nr:sulfurtransferase-like selenium metabolism protein YedF [Candidatus Pelethousia sp.]NCB31155.1 sulfurtransferase-like selenium metabolism protein YedF [Clostridia bacterium]
MAHYIDAMGKACPQPVILARKALTQGETPLTIAVDNSIAVENLKRLAVSQGMKASATEKDGRFEVTFLGTGQATQTGGLQPEQESSPAGGCYSVFIGKDRLGEGDPTLGYNLLKMFLYTLSQGDVMPASVLFMNGGVKLPAGEEQEVLASIQALQEKGSEVLVCGTCLNYYGIADKLKVGQVSNMYDIVSRMQAADKVLSV